MDAADIKCNSAELASPNLLVPQIPICRTVQAALGASGQSAASRSLSGRKPYNHSEIIQRHL
jgi:hypothetical protein